MPADGATQLASAVFRVGGRSGLDVAVPGSLFNHMIALQHNHQRVVLERFHGYRTLVTLGRCTHGRHDTHQLLPMKAGLLAPVLHGGGGGSMLAQECQIVDQSPQRPSLQVNQATLFSVLRLALSV